MKTVVVLHKIRIRVTESCMTILLDEAINLVDVSLASRGCINTSAKARSVLIWSNSARAASLRVYS